MISYKEKLNHITTFIFDVDGVFTDGTVQLFNDELEYRNV
jgi:3-deoxy-D-manno-octulosonate 8-phosphate phosphatase (KDO 8-P phosphatase)